jgi:hypothetical protein
MNMRMRHLFTIFLFTIPAWSGSIYRIDFSGTVTGGTLRAILDDQSGYSLPFALGSTISGFVAIDLSLLPTPTVDTRPDGSRTTYLDADVVNPQWISGQVHVTLPVLPDRALPVPDSFSLTPLLPVAGAVEDQAPIRSRKFIWDMADGVCCDILFAATQYQDAWSTEKETHSKKLFLGMLTSSATDFFPANATFPSPFEATNINVGSKFQATVFGRKRILTPPLFGIEEKYSMDIDFRVDHATGGLLSASSASSTGGAIGSVTTPEPGTMAAGLALVGLVIIRARRPGC